MNQETSGRRLVSRRNTLIILIILILAGGAAWYFLRGGGGAANPRGRPATSVGVAKAVVTDVPVTVSAIGTVQPIVVATVRPQLSGTLFSIDFTEGQMVTKGQPLAQMDPRPYRLALSQAQANMARDQAQLNDAIIDLNRYRGLLAQDSIARQQVDTQAALVKQLEGTVAADNATVGTAKLNLDYAAISAPASGRIGLRQADVGNYVTPGDANGIAVITQLDPIDVSFSLPQGLLPNVQKKLATGATLAATVRDQSGTSVLAEGSFLTFDNQIDTTSGTVKAKARFANPDEKLFPNQFVNMTLLVDTISQAVTLPISSVRNGADGDFVFLLQPDQTVKMQAVKVGPQTGDQVVITSGVTADDTAITEGADNLDDGSHVTLPSDTPGKGGKGASGDKKGKGRKKGG